MELSVEQLILPEEDRMLMRVFIDDRFGEGTSDMLAADASKTHTHAELALRFGLTRRAVSKRLGAAKACIKRVAERIGERNSQNKDPHY